MSIPNLNKGTNEKKADPVSQPLLPLRIFTSERAKSLCNIDSL